MTNSSYAAASSHQCLSHEHFSTKGMLVTTNNRELLDARVLSPSDDTATRLLHLKQELRVERGEWLFWKAPCRLQTLEPEAEMPI